MEHDYYYPRGEDKLKEFLENAAAQLAEYKLLPNYTIGVTKAQLQTGINAATRIVSKIDNSKSKAAELKAINADKMASKKADGKILKDLFQTIKNSKSTYNSTIEGKLWLKGKVKNIDVIKDIPELWYRKVAGKWQIMFNLHGWYDSIRLYWKKPGTDEFVPLDVTTSTPFIIKQTIPNGTVVYGIYIKNDEEVGQPSELHDFTL